MTEKTSPGVNAGLREGVEASGTTMRVRMEMGGGGAVSYSVKDAPVVTSSVRYERVKMMSGVVFLVLHEGVG